MVRVVAPKKTPSADKDHGKLGLLVFCAEQGFAGAFSERVLDSFSAIDAPETLFLIGTHGLSIATARELAALATDMGGVDAIVFTAGIGENSALVRRLICERLNWLGVDLDLAANELGASRIASEASSVDILVIATNEEAIIAGATRSLTQKL